MAPGGATFTMDVDDSELAPYFKQMALRAMDVTPYFKRLGAYQLRSVDKTFRKRGRPKWKKLGPYTIAMRRWGAESPNAPSPRRAFTTKVLEVTGGLRGSFSYRARSKRLDVGTNYVNSDIHQEGGTVKAPKRWKRSTVEVEQRQLVGIYPEDKKKAIEFAIRYLDKG